MKLSKLLSEELVVADMPATTKREAIAYLLDRIIERFPLLDRDKIHAAIEERERIENTAYGHGFAFPHARTDEVQRMYIALGISKRGLSDKTPDGVALRCVCLMLTPSNISQLYLQTLSAFARLARNGEHLKKMLETQTPLEVIDVVSESDVKVDRDLLVRDIMVEKVHCVKPDVTLKEVANLFYKHRIGSMPVVDEQQRVIGIVSNRDLIHAALPDYKSLIQNLSMAPNQMPFDDLLKATEKKTVGQIMTKEVATTTEDTPVVELAALMIFKNLRMVPVVRDDKLVGVVVISDIVSKIIRG
ncbi:MAG: CBS domain-containing protein [candidate division Zixibacteria bacterium]|nr:CBS domain-containing protein [candidate division Zixibacteria bacterium]